MIKVTIRKAAEKRKLKNPYQLAKSVGISKMVAGRIWENEQEPQLKTLDKICEAWGCDLSELVQYVRNGRKAR